MITCICQYVSGDVSAMSCKGVRFFYGNIGKHQLGKECEDRGPLVTK